MLEVNILGCGSSLGVPVIGCICSVCKSDSPYNKRLRSSIIINQNETRVLVDFGFNIKEQLINLGVCHLDAAILTHEHADHLNGIDELRVFFYIHGKPLEIFILDSIAPSIFDRYKYLFNSGMLKMNIVSEFHEIKVNNTIFQLFPQNHGVIKSLGIRVRDFVYSCDISSIPDKSEKYLYNTKAWVVDCVDYRSTIKHSGLEKIFQWIKKYSPKEVYLTNMSHNIDYHAILTKLPSYIKPLYDGSKIKL